MALIVGIALGCGIREDEFDCENAVSHLQECCQGFVASNVDCTYDPGGCASGPVYPEISVAESTCVQGETCARLQATGVCSRASAVPAGTTWSSESASAPEDDAAPPASPQVCP